MKKRMIILLSLIIAALYPVVYGENSSFTFLRMGNGARPAALSEAVTALPGDITSAFYNPGTLAVFDGKNQLAFAHNSFFGDVSQNMIYAGFKGTGLTFGGYISAGSIGKIQRRGDIATPEPLGEFSEDNFVAAFMLGASKRELSIGLALKYAYDKIDYASANSFMFDLGFLYRIDSQLRLGAALKNFGTKPKYIDESYQLATEYRLGLSYKPRILKEKIELAADGVFFNDNTDSKINLGIEYQEPALFALRAGYGFGYDSRGFSVGAGLIHKMLKFDYAFVPYKNDLGNTHRFTLIITI